MFVSCTASYMRRKAWIVTSIKYVYSWPTDSRQIRYDLHYAVHFDHSVSSGKARISSTFLVALEKQWFL
jgi:hypothetical protein